MYIAKDFTEYATSVDFFTHLKEYLVNIDIFTLVEENFTEEPYYFKLQYRNAVIKFEMSGYNRFNYYIYLLIDGDEILKLNQPLYITNNATTGETNRNVKIFLISNNNNLLFKLGPYSSELLSYTNTMRMIVTDNNLYCFASGNVTSANAVDVSDTSYTYRPYHAYGKSATELFLDPELPWTRVTDGAFYGNSIGITGLGGAECGKIYQLVDGTKYYAIFNNMAIPMGDEVNVDYETHTTTEVWL